MVTLNYDKERLYRRYDSIDRFRKNREEKRIYSQIGLEAKAKAATME